MEQLSKLYNVSRGLGKFGTVLDSLSRQFG
uniref:Uncharacterized protein n=1 Tax=Anguilla anguilla TaxID=7936 RepID=A0A0E9P6Q2_ANGAN